MNFKRWLPLVLAIVLGLISAKLARDAMVSGRNKSVDSNTIPMVTAARDIAPGDTFTAADLTTIRLPLDSVPAGSFRMPEEAVDRVATTPIVKGQPILEGLLAAKGTAGGVQTLVPTGMRAITLQVNEFSGVAGLLLPGCHVDIISVIKGDTEAGPTAQTIVENVEVWAVGREVSPAAAAAAANAKADPGAPAKPATNNLTLLVTPQQAEAVQMATVNGNPWLVLRNTKDTAPVNSDGTTFADLRGHKAGFIEPLTERTTKPTGTTNDPFAEGSPESQISSPFQSSRTRTIKFIRNGKEETMSVEVTRSVPAEWTATTNDPAEANGGK
jgi:pilus assembly protein CpaB